MSKAKGGQGHSHNKKDTMAGTSHKTNATNNRLIEEYRTQAEHCRLEVKRTPVRERRFELQAKAEYLDQLADELAKI
jgi:hypothetical protein